MIQQKNYQARELLKVAKECDELAVKYNSLLEFYNNINKGTKVPLS